MLTNIAWAAAALAGSYLIGSIPFGFLMAKWVKGIDIRLAGSGNIGATNVGRVVGGRWGILVLGLDCLKGLLPVLFIARAVPFFENPLHLKILCGVCVILGHMFPCWLRFRGGKGVATALGVVVVLAEMWAVLIGILVFAGCFVSSRYVSLSSMLAAIAFAICQMILLRPMPFSIEHWSLATFSLAVPALIIFRHRANCARLIKGEEPKFRAASDSGEEIQVGSDD